MTREYTDSQGVPIGGYDSPANAPNGYEDFIHIPTAADREEMCAHIAYNTALICAMPDMPDDIARKSVLSAAHLCDGGDPAEGKRLGEQVQDWRDLATADAHAAIERGDHGEAAMNYAIMRAARDE